MESDRELAQRAKTDPEAFGVLYERYVAAIYRYVYYRVGHVEDAEDLTARVFMHALKHIHAYQDIGAPFSAWLYRIAHNLVVNFHRDQQKRQAVSLDASPERDSDVRQPEAELDADHLIDAQRERARLLRAIRRLPEERQHLLVLKFVEQLSNAEIGQIMGRSEGAIKSLYHRTLVQLRELLAQPEL
ncbi:MAG: sigma-70 family RNA polymerase sigma factor [Thermoflexales bacterium]|nr:sigma-70 family RNA polymerase sigma factor [Thermoflexales bacterium]